MHYFVDQVIPELVALAEKNPSLRDGALASSLEEYVEAKCLGHYLEHKCLLPRRDLLIVQKNEYLGGVIDFTGETRAEKLFCIVVVCEDAVDNFWLRVG